MDINIIEKKENPLLRRTELIADVGYEGTAPTRQTMRDEISKKLKVSPEVVIVRHIYPFFGDKKIEVVVHVYQSKEDAEKIESKIYTQRMLGKKKGAGEKKEKAEKEEAGEEGAEE